MIIRASVPEEVKQYEHELDFTTAFRPPARNRRRLHGPRGLRSLLPRLRNSQPPHPVREGVVRLSSNENPYGPSPKALKAMSDALACPAVIR